MNTHRDHLVLPATVDNIPSYRDFLARACSRADLSEDDCLALTLAVDEACTNIIEHGYAGEAGRQIELTFVADDTEAWVEIVDDGPPFRPEDIPPPDLEAGWEDRPIGGLGWHLIRRSVDSIRYERDNGRNRLTLIRQRARPRRKGAQNDGCDG